MDQRLNPAIAKRRARRALLADPVSEAQIDLLLQAAHLAPSCFNSQPWRFVVVDDPELLGQVKAAMSRGNYWTAPAPVIIAVASHVDLDCRLSDRRDYFLFGCGMAVGNLMIQATDLGLVAHPIAGFDPVKVKSLLGIPEDYTLVTLVIVGHPGDPSTLSEKHREIELGERERRPQSDVAAKGRFNFPQDPLTIAAAVEERKKRSA